MMRITAEINFAFDGTVEEAENLLEKVLDASALEDACIDNVDGSELPEEDFEDEDEAAPEVKT